MITNGKKIKELARAQFDKNKFFTMSGTWIAENSSLNTKGAPREIIEIAGKRFECRHIDIHLILYEFFTNFGSVLDRVTYEIDMLYDLRITLKERHWSTLIREKPYLEKLGVKDRDLADLLKDYAGKLQVATRYRNRIVHDGIIRIDTDISIKGLKVMLAQDPNDDASPMNVDAIELCKEVKYNLLGLLDKSYKLMLQRIQNHGNPPW